MTLTRARIEELVRATGPIQEITASCDALEQLAMASTEGTGFLQRFQMASLRLRCAEIVFTTGSQAHRDRLEQEAERLYAFALEKKIDNAREGA